MIIHQTFDYSFTTGLLAGSEELHICTAKLAILISGYPLLCVGGGPGELKLPRVSHLVEV